MANHRDVEYAVDDCSGKQRTFKTANEAAGFAVSVGLSHGEPVFIDVLVYSKAGARSYGGDDFAELYAEDPEASVSDRIEIRVNHVGRVA